jgi:hypothetical protein
MRVRKNRALGLGITLFGNLLLMGLGGTPPFMAGSRSSQACRSGGIGGVSNVGAGCWRFAHAGSRHAQTWRLPRQPMA